MYDILGFNRAEGGFIPTDTAAFNTTKYSSKFNTASSVAAGTVLDNVLPMKLGVLIEAYNTHPDEFELQIPYPIGQFSRVGTVKVIGYVYNLQDLGDVQTAKVVFDLCDGTGCVKVQWYLGHPPSMSPWYNEHSQKLIAKLKANNVYVCVVGEVDIRSASETAGPIIKAQQVHECCNIDVVLLHDLEYVDFLVNGNRNVSSTSVGRDSVLPNNKSSSLDEENIAEFSSPFGNKNAATPVRNSIRASKEGGIIDPRELSAMVLGILREVKGERPNGIHVKELTKKVDAISSSGQGNYYIIYHYYYGFTVSVEEVRSALSTGSLMRSNILFS